MSDRDRQKWNTRYAAGAYGTRVHPTVLLEAFFEEIAPKCALDVACGAGRNAIWLANRGVEVDAVDISAVALAAAERRAQVESVQINWLERDLDSPLVDLGHYDLILLIRYADLQLTRRLIELLAPGGVLLVEAHLGGPLFSAASVDVGGPGSERFRLAPGALASACDALEPIYSREHLLQDPDGALMALTQFVGRRAP